jgi:hypothetical protein
MLFLRLALVPSWSEIRPGYQWAPADPFYTLCSLAAGGLIALSVFRPAGLTVDVVLEGGRQVDGVVRATATPSNPYGDYLRAPSSQRQAQCRLERRTCRLSLSWPEHERPLLPQDHTVQLTLESHGRVTDLGVVTMGAPRWGRVVADVTCRAGANCEEL